jgi:hypothetical protein
VVSVTPRPRFIHRERLPVTIGSDAGWAPELVRTQTPEEKSFASAGDRILVVQSVSDTILTELPQLLMPVDLGVITAVTSATSKFCLTVKYTGIFSFIIKCPFNVLV